MKSRTRYGLITTGIVLFILLTPLVILYVSGTRYDFKNHHFTKTGIIAVKTAPRGADVFLDGKKVASTQVNIKFLQPGDYDIRISKPGFFDWTKRLNVRAQYVTYVNKELDYLVLLKNSGENKEISKNVLSFVGGRNRLVFLQSNKAVLSDIDNPFRQTEVELGNTLVSASVIASEDEGLYFISGRDAEAKIFSAVLDTNHNKIYNLSSIISGDASVSDFKFNNGALYELSNKTLYSINWQTAQKSVFLNNIIGYGFAGDSVYILSNNQVKRIGLPNSAPEILATNLPSFKTAQFYISAQKQIFLLGDKNLYSIGTSLNQIAQGVNTVDINNVYRKMMFATSNEIDLYDLNNGGVGFVTRSSEQIKNSQIFYKLGWLFFIRNNQMQSLELDTRDHQNNYTFAQVSPTASSFAAPDAQSLIILSDGVLSRIQIR